MKGFLVSNEIPNDCLIKKRIKQVFDIYRNYKFKLDHQDLFKKSNLVIDDERIQKITDFIRLVDTALQFLHPEESKILVSSFINKIHYRQHSCSQSSFFVIRRKACKNLYNLIFSKIDSYEIEQMFYSLKMN